MMRRRQRLTGWTLLELLTVLLVTAVLCALFFPVLAAQREDVRREVCADRIHTLAVAMGAYADINGAYPRGMTLAENLPDAEKAETFSWVAALLPHQNEAELFSTIRFDSPPRSEANTSYRTAPVEGHICPADITARAEAQEPLRAVRRSNYVGNLGSTNFGQNDCNGWQQRASYRFAGAAFSFHRSVQPAEVLDGLANTAAFSEAVVNPNETFDRGDYGLARISAGAGFTSYNGPNTTLSTDAGRKAWNADDFDPPFPAYESGFPLTATFPARSRHPNGVNVAMLDGAVRFVADSVDGAAWRDLTSAYDRTRQLINPDTLSERLFIDWIYQDGDWNPAECFVSETTFEREAALTLKALEGMEGETEEFAARRQALIEKKRPGSDPAWGALYSEICTARRAERLAIVAEQTPEIVYVKHHVMGGSHYAYTEDTTDHTAFDVSPDRKPGASLRLLTIAADGSVQDRALLETATGVIRDPDVSFDAQRIVFSMRDDFENDDFGLCEYEISTGKTRTITDPAGFADYEPMYLPNGEILFVSSRCMRISDCWRTEISNLYACDRNGQLMRRLGYDQVTTNYPKLLADGRVLYTRWEYQDRGQIYPQPLFTMNPDGTGQTEYYGNSSFFPTTILHARSIPGSSKVIAIASGHHTRQRGKLILVDRNRGTQEASGIEYTAPRSEAVAEKVDVAQQSGPQYQYPYAIDEQNYLVGFLPEGVESERYSPPFGLYWMDAEGQRELLAWDKTVSCCQPVPLIERAIPPQRPSQVDYTKTTGRFYVQDVYVGPSMEGVERGTIKKLRVIEPLFNRVVTVGGNRNQGPAGGAFVPTPMAAVNGAWDGKRVLGETDVFADGSAYFEVPAETPLYFQLLDDKDRVVQTMRSWSTLMPGEFFACVGCHEPKENTPIAPAAEGSAKSLALAGPPTPLAIPVRTGTSVHPDSGFSFVRDVQPILDRRCVVCHDGRPYPDGRAGLSLLGDMNTLPSGLDSPAESKRSFSAAYLNLTRKGPKNEFVHWLDMQSVPSLLPPYDSGAVQSRLIAMFDSTDAAHQNTGITCEELRTLALWIDLAVPYCGFPTEGNLWNDDDWGLWTYYSTKKSVMEERLKEHRRNLVRLVAQEAVEPVAEFRDAGREVKQTFLATWPGREYPNRISGLTGDTPRNLAYNPEATWEISSYPHASSNAEDGYADTSLAKNAIDGDSTSAWRPGLRTDEAFTVDFGLPAAIERIVLTLQADSPYKSAVVSFDDGTEEKITLQNTSDPQTFTFPKHTTRKITLRRFEQDFPLKPGGIVEFEAWGTL